jgi:hypothetical protein
LIVEKSEALFRLPKKNMLSSYVNFVGFLLLVACAEFANARSVAVAIIVSFIAIPFKSLDYL